MPKISVNASKGNFSIGNKRVIISLTSYPSRIKTVHIAIKSLIDQTYKADKIILWLAEEQFPNKEKDLPKQLLDLVPLGLTIDWCSDIKSYKKLVPALIKYPNDIIITADDDLIYNKNCIKSLIDTYKKYPNCIIANRTHYITFKNGKINKFINWIFWNKYRKPSYNVFPTTGGTVLYYPNCLYKDATNIELFSELAEYTDDHWFWAMAVINGTKIKLSEPYFDKLKFIRETQEEGLSVFNCTGGNNDVSMEKIITHYPCILNKLNKSFYQSFSQRIFSVKKEYIENFKIKIITILGIKIQFKRNLYDKN